MGLRQEKTARSGEGREGKSKETEEEVDMDSFNGRKVPIAKRREAEEESDERVRLMNECMDRSGET